MRRKSQPRSSISLTFGLLTVVIGAASAQTGGCEPGWSRSPDKCFGLFGNDIDGAERLTWSQADEACRAMGANLAKILEEKMQPILSAMLVQASASNVWIGLNDRTAEGVYRWADGTPLTGFTNWGPNQPDNGNNAFQEDCMYLRANEDFPGEWYDGYCDYPRAYICEKPQ
ncbi:C-type lectin domain family 4 member F-like, partial [Acanthaster planci]|uniref:C-type lectin domain family 4 member F-like n=1 Tax=Acanthaster planci TaxID=133434 RepID=A0A8B8A297_ACAPL